jgi:hypothetical protein
MGKNDVQLKITGDSGDAQRAWLEVIGVLKQMETELGRMGQTMERESRRGAKAMEQQVSVMKKLQDSFANFQKVVGIVSSVRSAFSLLTAEMNAVYQAGDKLLKPRLNYENELSAMLASTPAADFDKIVAQIQKYNGPVDRAAIARAVRTVSSTRGRLCRRPRRFHSSRTTRKTWK